MEAATGNRSIKKALINRADKGYFNGFLIFLAPLMNALSISLMSLKIDSWSFSVLSFVWVSTKVCATPLVFDFFIANEIIRSCSLNNQIQKN